MGIPNKNWSKSLRPDYYECGTCGHFHKPGYLDDCRNDLERFSANELDDYHGENLWFPHDLPESGA